MTLEPGRIYDQSALTLTGWTEGDGSAYAWYDVEYYFDSQGRYLGPDVCGVEPVFAP